MLTASTMSTIGRRWDAPPRNTADVLRQYRFHTLARVIALAVKTLSCAVEVVEWPSQQALRRVLANAGVPRLLIVDRDTSAPDWIGIDETWVWSDASDEQLDQASRDLLARLGQDSTIERVGTYSWTSAGRVFCLTPLLARLFAELVAERGVTVTHERLMAAGWGQAAVAEHTLTDAVQRLRNQLVGTGLLIRTRRAVGFVLA